MFTLYYFIQNGKKVYDVQPSTAMVQMKPFLKSVSVVVIKTGDDFNELVSEIKNLPKR